MAENEHLPPEWQEGGAQRQALEEALEEDKRLWGYDPATGLALPRAAQLECRLAVGRMYVAEHPDDPRGRKQLAALEAEYEKMSWDAEDQKRCADWYAAHCRLTALLEEFSHALAGDLEAYKARRAALIEAMHTTGAYLKPSEAPVCATALPAAQPELGLGHAAQ